MSTQVSRLAGWLRCPHCHGELAEHARLTLECTAGHRFDVNKRGFLTTLDGSRGISGDPREIIQARADFLALGHFAPIADAVADAALGDSPSGANPSVTDTPPVAIIDSGCGTGYYLGRLLARRPGIDALALDASAAAVAIAVAATGAPGVVADVWQHLPVRDARADVILCVFAPRNPAEFSRMLRAHGRLVVVTPQEDHLRQLRERGEVISIQENKLERLDEALSPYFALARRTQLSYELTLSPRERKLIASMGPSGHHQRSTRTLPSSDRHPEPQASDAGHPGDAAGKNCDGYNNHGDNNHGKNYLDDERNTVTVAVDISLYSADVLGSVERALEEISG